MPANFIVSGVKQDAEFTLKLYRGEGMVLLAMDWKNGAPPNDFVGFGMQYRPPGSADFFPVKNRIGFATADGKPAPTLDSIRSPIQKFRWIHFPWNTSAPGSHEYQVCPAYMDEQGQLSYGPQQEADIELGSDTYPGVMNVAFTRGFVASQAFVDKFSTGPTLNDLLPADADGGLDFTPTNPKAKAALDWMGFEARRDILDVLDRAVADPTAQVCAVAYDLNEPEIVSRLEQLGPRLRVIIDNSGTHNDDGSAENEAAKRLTASAGAANVKRQHMGGLQHNKTICVDGKAIQAALCGSTNFSWRAFYVQSNNALLFHTAGAVQVFKAAFDSYWAEAGFDASGHAEWQPMQLDGVDIRITFSPHSSANAALKTMADDIGTAGKSLFYSLAFLYQTPGVIRNALKRVEDGGVFTYGISDKDTGGLTLRKADGARIEVSPSQLTDGAPEPFKSEPSGGAGIRMHHKFVVKDFNTPQATVYVGSHNFSVAADDKNGENLLCIRDARIATAYALEALSIFDHYLFRVKKDPAGAAKTTLVLARPPKAGAQAWWQPYFTDGSIKSQDRQLFA